MSIYFIQLFTALLKLYGATSYWTSCYTFLKCGCRQNMTEGQKSQSYIWGTLEHSLLENCGEQKLTENKEESENKNVARNAFSIFVEHECWGGGGGGMPREGQMEWKWMKKWKKWKWKRGQRCQTFTGWRQIFPICLLLTELCFQQFGLINTM